MWVIITLRYINYDIPNEVMQRWDGKYPIFYLNNEKEEIQITVSLVNYIISEKLAERLEERGLEPYKIWFRKLYIMPNRRKNEQK